MTYFLVLVILVLLVLLARFWFKPRVRRLITERQRIILQYLVEHAMYQEDMWRIWEYVGDHETPEAYELKLLRDKLVKELKNG